MADKICLTVAELQASLGVGRSTAYQLIHRGDFPAVHLGRKVLIPVDGLRAWLEKQSTGERSDAVC